MGHYRTWVAVLLLVAIASPPASWAQGSNGSLNTIGNEVIGGIIGAVAGLTAVTITTVYLVHRSHTSLSGCVQQGDAGLILTTNSGDKYALVDAPADLKTGDRLSLRGHKLKGQSFANGPAFKVDRIAKDHGPCGR